jgi:hypothetical protein
MDKEYWKRIYRPKWGNGKRRAEEIKSLIESWGFKVEPFGFLPTSVEYVKTSPDEKGKPDWKIIVVPDRYSIPLEATGTAYSRGSDEVWIRNDKFEFAERHKELECWASHILESKGLVRFIKLENKDKYQLEERDIQVTENYRIIPEDAKELISAEEFHRYLESLKESIK